MGTGTGLTWVHTWVSHVMPTWEFVCVYHKEPSDPSVTKLIMGNAQQQVDFKRNKNGLTLTSIIHHDKKKKKKEHFESFLLLQLMVLFVISEYKGCHLFLLWHTNV